MGEAFLVFGVVGSGPFLLKIHGTIGTIQRKMLELREKKVPLKSSEEKCCVLQ